MDNEKDPRKIKGNPTKELFVYILTRDLSVEDAINDLIDNCIDGAVRIKVDENFNGLYVNITIDEKKFIIEDNCGGIPIDLARDYAFRFGRAKEMKDTPFSIGQFGVGMKRAIFKLGDAFYVESTHQNSEFAITVEISDWLKQKDENGNDDWSFEFNDDYKEGLENDIQNTGTKIEVTPIRESLRKFLTTQTFLDSLKRGIENKHMQAIYKGMRISVNGEELKSKRPKLIVSDEIKIAKWEKKFDNEVEVTIYAGIGEPKVEEGGWYIFCNDRLLLGPEQTSLTGWTGKGGGGVALYHNQFNRFRGLVYFKATLAKNLPWNTSKNGIEASSPVFLHTRSRMIEMMKPIIKFLNLMKKEREDPENTEEDELVYKIKVNEGTSMDASQLKNETEHIAATFNIPEVKTKKVDTVKMVSISYKKPENLVGLVKKALKANSNKNVGEKTFDYFVDMEEIEYE